VFAPRVAKLKTKDSSSTRAVEASTRASRRAAVDRNHPGAPDKGAAALFAVSGVAGPAWDLATVPVLPSSSGARSSESEPSRLGSWARSVARAPETSPADAAERSADRAADAAVRGELPAQPLAPRRHRTPARRPGAPGGR
jgi:hypothetical protein